MQQQSHFSNFRLKPARLAEKALKNKKKQIHRRQACWLSQLGLQKIFGSFQCREQRQLCGFEGPEHSNLVRSICRILRFESYQAFDKCWSQGPALRRPRDDNTLTNRTQHFNHLRNASSSNRSRRGRAAGWQQWPQCAFSCSQHKKQLCSIFDSAISFRIALPSKSQSYGQSNRP